MSTEHDTPEPDPIPPDVMADTQAVIDMLMTGKPLDPETVRRIREQGDRIREEVFRRYGLLDIGVPAIRALRNGGDE